MFKMEFDPKELGGAIRLLPDALKSAMAEDASLAVIGQRAAQAQAPILTGKLRTKIKINKRITGKRIRWTVSPGIKYGSILAAGVAQKYTRIGKNSGHSSKERRRLNWVARQKALEGGWRIAPYDFMRAAQRAMNSAAPEYARRKLDLAIKHAKARAA